MSFFKRLFSSDYRQAVAFEGAGRYREAAEKYMLSGERGSVVRMHRLIARSETDPYARVQALQRALDLMPTIPVDEEEEEELELIQTQVELDLAGALVTLVDATGLMDRRDRGHLEQAATLYTQHEEFDRAGEVYAQLGYVNKASEAFKRAGNIQRMEEMFQRSETADVAEAEFDRAYDTYEFAVMAGDPLGALEALERCVELHPHDAGLSAKLQVLRERMPRCGRITLTARGGSWILVGGTSVSIGREDDNEILLLSAGVSRRHARLSRRAGAPTLEDAGSRHGTRVGGATISRATPLMDEGQFQIGRELVLDYRFRPGGELPALFEVAGGYLKGQRFVWADRLVTTGIPPDEPEWIPGGLALEFIRGYWHAVPAQSRGTLLINGQSATVPTLLRLRDELVFDGVTLTVE